MIVCAPNGSDEVVQLAVALPLLAASLRVPQPEIALPSLEKVIAPPPSLGATVAVKVTGFPESEVAEDALTVVELVACCTVSVVLPELPT